MSPSDVLFSSMFPIPINSTTTFTQPGIKPSNNGKECKDLHGRNIPQGVHYVPGPDECTLCVCDEEGGPIWCKAVLCSPPQDCKSFRVGNSCCEFICLDDTMTGGKGHGKPTIDTAEVVPKIVIASVCSMLSLALLSFLVYRLRQRHIQGRINSAEACHSTQMCDECDDTRSLDFSNDCYFERPGVNSNYYPPHYLASWKPPSTYFPPRGEAPPPYEEAIATTSNCIMPHYLTAGNFNGFSPAAVNTTIILTNENINQNQSQTQPTQTSAVESLKRTSNSSVVNGESLVSNSNSAEAARSSVNNFPCSSSPAKPSKVENAESVEPVPGPSCGYQSSNSGTGPTSTVPPKVITASLKGANGQSHNHVNQAFPCNSVGNLDNSEALVCPSGEDPVFLTLDAELPPYSASNFRDCFRHSLTLPRHPRNFVELGIDLDSDYSRRHQQRYSLQFNVADWSSSSSTLSLSTPTTPCGVRRPESSLSSSTSSSNNTQTTH